jgi:hypothetical protein
MKAVCGLTNRTSQRHRSMNAYSDSLFRTLLFVSSILCSRARLQSHLMNEYSARIVETRLQPLQRYQLVSEAQSRLTSWCTLKPTPTMKPNRTIVRLFHQQIVARLGTIAGRVPTFLAVIWPRHESRVVAWNRRRSLVEMDIFHANRWCVRAATHKDETGFACHIVRSIVFAHWY